MLSHEKTYCPVINVTKRTSAVLNDEGDVIDKEIATDDNKDIMSSDTTSSLTTSIKANKKTKSNKTEDTSRKDADIKFISSLKGLFDLSEEEKQFKRDEIEIRRSEVEVSKIKALNEEKNCENQMTLS